MNCIANVREAESSTGSRAGGVSKAASAYLAPMNLKN
jgi:hypothetical protein